MFIGLDLQGLASRIWLILCPWSAKFGFLRGLRSVEIVYELATWRKELLVMLKAMKRQHFLRSFWRCEEERKDHFHGLMPDKRSQGKPWL